MSQTLVSETLTGDTPTSVTLSATRTDTGAVIVAAAAMASIGGGTYTYSITDPAAGLTYGCTIVFTFADGATITRQRNVAQQTAPVTADTLPRYLTLTEALALAPLLLNMDSFLNASSQLQAAALAAATSDVDTTTRYQGRKVDLQQVLEFPRVAYESNRSVVNYGYVGPIATNAIPGGSVVWDWDPVNQIAVVPDRVKRATLIQAASRLDKAWNDALDRVASGLTSQKIGSASETYDIKAVSLATSGTLTLIPDAALLLDTYRIRQGRFL